MRILLLCTSFNSLSQRLHVALAAAGHSLSVEFDVNDAVTRDAVRLFRPDLVLAPYLRRAIPQDVTAATPCLVVHPGPVGDRGPNALDWAILDGAAAWGVTVLQANAVLDGGDVWAHRRFDMRAATKASHYRAEAADAAEDAVLEAVAALEAGGAPTPLATLATEGGRWRGRVPAARRRVDWAVDDAETALRKIRSADGQPGAEGALFGAPVRLYDAHPAQGALGAGAPGEVLGARGHALLVRAAEGALWIGAVRPEPDAGARGFKRPARLAFADRASPEIGEDEVGGYQPIRYREERRVGFLSFDFYNGAMATADCQALLAAYRAAAARPETRAIVLEGGAEFFSNGMHLGAIEAAASAADASMANIEAIDDVADAVIRTTDKVTISAIGAAAGAGGVFFALAADIVLARRGVVLNPHYKNMGNLYGSEYWTYLLPRRAGVDGARAVMASRLPMGVDTARRYGLVDEILPADRTAFRKAVADRAATAAADPALASRLAEKARRRADDEAAKPLADYRAEELRRMRRNFYGFDPSYHVARYNFITKVPHSHTPLHLATHRAGA